MSGSKVAQEDALIEQTLANMRVERRSTYNVAASSQIDWCPCCGINIRLFDQSGNLTAKLILNRDDAKLFGRDVMLAAHQSERLCGDAKSRARLEERLLQAGASTAQ